MHYVRYIMSVHFSTERSERSQTVWLIPFLYTQCVGLGASVMLVYQGRTSTSSTCSQSIHAAFPFIFANDHTFPLLMSRASDGQELFLPSGSAPILPPPQPQLHVVFRAPVQFCLSTMASTVSPTKEVLPFLF